MTPEEIKKFGEEILEACKYVMENLGSVIPHYASRDFTGPRFCPLGALLLQKTDKLTPQRPPASVCTKYLNISEVEARGFIQGFENPGEFNTDGDILFYNLGKHFRKLSLNGWNEKN